MKPDDTDDSQFALDEDEEDSSNESPYPEPPTIDFESDDIMGNDPTRFDDNDSNDDVYPEPPIVDFESDTVNEQDEPDITLEVPLNEREG